MSKTLTTFTAFGATALLASAGFAQGQIEAKRAGVVKDAGVFHVATGTWTRGASTAFSADTAYDNTANSGFFGNMGASHFWTDNGRLPSAAGTCTASTYHVDGFQVGYCSYEGPTGQPLTFDFRELMASCVDPIPTATVAAFSALGPGSSSVGTQACWLVTFDLAGTSLEFDMQADGDGVFDGSESLDNFGFTFGQVILSGTGGPLLKSDPNNAPFGDDTYYQNPGASLGGSGLGQLDQFWLFDPSLATAAGCYWFGGYQPGTPWTGWHLEVYADGGTCGGTDCVTYCVSDSTSVSAGATISTTDNCNTDGADQSTISLHADGVPNQPGIFFHGTNVIDVPFGCGHLCTAGTIIRGGVVFGASEMADYDFAVGAGTSAGDGNFQYWFRDPMHSGACGNVFNTSDALTY